MSIEVDRVPLAMGGTSAGRIRCVPKRTYSGPDSPLSSCCLSADAKHVTVACLDNFLYRWTANVEIHSRSFPVVAPSHLCPTPSFPAPLMMPDSLLVLSVTLYRMRVLWASDRPMRTLCLPFPSMTGACVR